MKIDMTKDTADRKTGVNMNDLKLNNVRTEAALKAWSTIRLNRIKKIKRKNESIGDYIFNPDSRKIVSGYYKLNPPIIKPSKLTYIENGGIGKELSDGWAINYAIGCTHACRFCYVDAIHKKYGEQRIGKAIYRPWGNYFFIPKNIDEVIEKTNWNKWKGEEALMCSTHDPYLPQLVSITRKILEKALPAGIKLCIQTRSPLVMKDFDLLKKYPEQVRIQISIATMNHELSRLIEPRVAPPESRFNILERAKQVGLRTGIIIAPVFPTVKLRPDPVADLSDIIDNVAKVKPNYVYGESLHARGSNFSEIYITLGEKPELNGFDIQIEKEFYRLLKKYHIKGKWWPEHK